MGGGFPLAAALAVSAGTVAAALPSAFERTGSLAFVFLPFGAALFAFLYALTRSPLVFLIAPATYAAAFALSGDPLASLLAVGFLPPGFALAAFLPKKEPRAAAVVRVSAFIAIPYVAYVAFSSLITGGSLSGGGIEAFFAPQLALVRGVLTNASLSDGENIVYLYNAEQVELLVSYLYLMAPALLIVTANIMAFAVTAIYYRIMRFFGAGVVVAPRGDPRWELRLSVISAYVFCAAYAVSVLFTDGLTAANVIASNLMLILIPGFSLIGLRFSLTRLRERHGMAASVLFTAAVFAIFLVSAPLLLTMLSFAGVAETIIRNFKAKRGTAG